MEQSFYAIVSVVLYSLTTGVTSLQCYQCVINPLPGHYYNTTKRLCSKFDHSDKFIVDCPFSTMCMKQEFYLDIQNGVRIENIVRDCAPQKNEYQDYKNGMWSPKMEILEPYEEGCENVDYKGEKSTPATYCYCRKDLCNSSPTTSHEGYTDIMGVIVVFNLMKYINSLR